MTSCRRPLARYLATSHSERMQDAVAVQRPAQDDVAVVARQRAAHLDQSRPCVPLHEAARCRRRRRSGGGGCSGAGASSAGVCGSPARFQVGGRGAQEAPVRHDAGARSGGCRATRRSGSPGRKPLSTRSIGRSVSCSSHFDLGIAHARSATPAARSGAAETQASHSPAAGPSARRGRCDTDSSISRMLGQDARRLRQIAFAFAGQAEAARGAVDQPHAQALLEHRQALGDGRRRQAELARGCRTCCPAWPAARRTSCRSAVSIFT